MLLYHHIISFCFHAVLKFAIFLDCFKIAKIILNYKINLESELANHKPISLLFNFSKLSKKIIAIRILAFQGKHAIIKLYVSNPLSDAHSNILNSGVTLTPLKKNLCGSRRKEKLPKIALEGGGRPIFAPPIAAPLSPPDFVFHL